MISFESTGSFAKSDAFFQRMKRDYISSILRKYGERGVLALAEATPIDTSETAHSWTYEVTRSGDSYYLDFKNSHIEDGVSVAILIQYGHGTGTGGYVPGRDYINPVIKPIFDQILSEIWAEVTR